MVFVGERVVKRMVRRLPFPPIFLYRMGIIFGLLVVEAALGYVIVEFEKLEFILAACIAPVAAFLFYRMRRIEYGIMAIVLTAGLVRFSLPTGTESEIVASLLVSAAIVALWLVQMLVVERRLWLKPVRTNIPLVAFMLVCAISFVWSNAFRDVLVVTWGTFPMVQLASLAVMLLLPAVFLLVSNVVETLRWLKVLWVIFLVLGTGAVISQLLRLPTARIINSSGVFPLWIVSLTYPQALFNRELRSWQRIGLLGLCGLWLYYQLGLGMVWLSGWGPALVTIVVTTFFRSKRLFLVLMLIMVIYVGVRFDYFYDKVYVESVEEGDMERLELWQTNLEHVANHPLFGTGPAGYAVYYMSYHPENARSTHNNFFDIIAQTGIVGMFFYLWFFAALARTAIELCKWLKHTHGFEAAFAYGMVGGVGGAVVSMMLGDWIIPFAYNQTVEGFDHSVYAWVLMGALVSLHHIVNARQPLPQNAQGGPTRVSAA